MPLRRSGARDRDERELTVVGGHPIKRDASLYCRLFAVLYETGMRSGEAYQLRWERIKFDCGIIEIRHDPKAVVRTKTGKTRTVQMITRSSWWCPEPESNRHGVAPGGF